MGTARLRTGVIGSGLVAQVMHLPYLAELSDRFEVRALCDSSPTVAAHCAGKYGIGRWFTDWRDLLAEDLDAVLVLTSGSHAEIAVAAAGAGMHVLTEKPMCYSAAEGTEMLAAARRAGVTLMVGVPETVRPGVPAGGQRAEAAG